MHKRTKVCSAVLLALGGAAGLTSAPAFGQATLERVAVRSIVETISGLRLATRRDLGADPGGRVMRE